MTNANGLLYNVMAIPHICERNALAYARKREEIVTDEKCRKIRRIYEIFVALWTGLVGALFIAQVWSIYGSAESEPYTTEIIRKKFSQISVFVWIWLIAVLLGGVGSLLFPEEKPRLKAYISPQKTLLRLKGLLPEYGEHWTALYRRQRIRCVVYAVVGVFCALALALCGTWLLQKNYVPVRDSAFFQEGDGVSDRLLRMLPWALLAVAAVAATAVYRSISLQKDCAYVKAQIAASKRQTNTEAYAAAPEEKGAQRAKRFYAMEKAHAEKKKTRRANERLAAITRIVLGVCAIALIVVGVANGGMTDVFDKAVKICTQCIGLG